MAIWIRPALTRPGLPRPIFVGFSPTRLKTGRGTRNVYGYLKKLAVHAPFTRAINK